MPSGPDSDIQYLPGVGPRRAALLRSELGVSTLGELVRIYPFRYVDRSGIMQIAGITPGSTMVQFKGTVIRTSLFSKAGKPVFEALFRQGMPFSPPEPKTVNGAGRLKVTVSDGTAEMDLTFFKGIRYTFTRLEPGRTFLFYGKPSEFGGRLNMVHPEIDSPSDANVSSSGYSITGVYPSTEKLKTGGITGRVMTKLMAEALKAVLPTLEETLPEYLLRNLGLAPASYALRNIHFPSSPEALHQAEYRLKFEELFLLQVSLLRQKFVRSRSSAGFVMEKVGRPFNDCYKSLPYDLTGAQKRVIREIRADMATGRQMNRLLQGDVGSGKTMVAVLSSLIAVGNGYQACIMAPTEVLAQQHFANISKYLAPTGVSCCLLTGSTKASERKKILPAILDGSVSIVVGTHALIEDTVQFRSLALAVIDEQHRFGVDQRARLWNKAPGSTPPHVLVMTATPIPRTLAMTLYGDLDVSVIDEMPPGRKPIETLQITESRRPSLNKFVREQIALGRQAFIVYPMIFENEKLDYKNLESGYERTLEDFPMPRYKVAMVHGKQTDEEKKFNMDAFAAGRADILVSTTVIEVGVDVPNASVMVVESAERFGLSQLHQLRGRVGRGSDKSYCILVRGDKLSKESRKRLDLLCSTEDGFVLAEEDMKMRGPGDMEGTQQSGLPVALNIASLARDGLILSRARAEAEKVLQADPELSSPLNSRIRAELSKGKYNIADYSKIS